MTGEQVTGSGIMIAKFVGEGTDQGHVLHCRAVSAMLTEMKPGIRWGWSQLTADFPGRIWFRIE